MFDNVAFEVVIGLVFVYLLYSLLITILSELVAAWLNIRGNLLRTAIERMLNDGYYYTMEKNKKRFGKYYETFRSFFYKKQNTTAYNIRWRRGAELKERREFRQSFAGRFYDYPAIKYLGRLEKVKEGKLTLSKPAYISAAYFAESLINYLADKGEGKTTLDKISFCLHFNTYHIQPNTLRQFTNLLETVTTLDDYKTSLMNWYVETMDRANGWYKRKLKLISFLLGFIIAIAFNVDSLKIAKILANDKDARNQLINMGLAMSKDSARYKDFTNGNGDTLHSQAILDSGFARVQKDINSANQVLGLGWDFSHSIKKDSLLITASDAAGRYIDSLQNLIAASKNISNGLAEKALLLNTQKLQIDTIIKRVGADTLQLQKEKSYGVTNKTNIDALSKIMVADTMAVYRAKLDYGIMLAKIKIDSASLQAGQQLAALLYNKINGTTGKRLVVIDSISQPGSNKARMIFGKRKLSSKEKTKSFIVHVFWYSFAGFVTTALALSLGAPFWFDMLNKLIAIRSAGVKPEEKKEDATSKTNIIANRPPAALHDLTPPQPEPITDIIEAAYVQYAAAIRSIPGVKSIFTVTRKGVKQLQVNVDNGVTKAELFKQFNQGIVMVGQTTVPINIVESGVPAAHTGDGLISNSSGLNGFGSLGCIVKWKDMGTQHILSCWHVLKGDLNYAVTDTARIIKEKNTDNILAERWAGGIKAQYDYGLAECLTEIGYLDNALLRGVFNISNTAIINFRIVSKDDITNQAKIKYYDALQQTITTGIIYSDSDSVEIDYPDKTRVMEDMLLLTNDNEEAISKGGNSGSVVFDMQNNAIAMIVGGDNNYTYAVKISHVFKIHTEMIIA